MPQISCTTDIPGRSDARGSFSRVYITGETVTLSAQPVYGSLVFKQWEVSDGTISTNSTLQLKMVNNKRVHAKYEAMNGNRANLLHTNLSIAPLRIVPKNDIAPP
jgi:hypothetical protein